MLAQDRGFRVGATDAGVSSRFFCLILSAAMGLVASAAWGQPTIETVATFNGTDGVGFGYGLTSDSKGDIYGSTRTSGSGGTVFQLVNGTIQTLSTGSDADLTADAFGNVYGTQFQNGQEVLFKISPGGVFTTVATINDEYDSVLGSVFTDAQGNVYGAQLFTTTGQGNVFKYVPGGTITTVTSFQFPTDNSYGSPPGAGIVLDSHGNIYGSMDWGGDLSMNSGTGAGTIFKISTNGTVAIPVVFDGTNGINPQGSLTVDVEGNIYGTTSGGGEYEDGTIFKISPDGTFATLASFDGSNGNFPVGRLLMDAAGNLYGTTEIGGASGGGNVFKLSTDGTLTDLASFDWGGTFYPVGDLAVDAEGNLYGTVAAGGDTTLNGGAGYGAIFEITDSGFVTSVPEPAFLSFIAVASMGLLIRRGRTVRCCR